MADKKCKLVRLEYDDGSIETLKGDLAAGWLKQVIDVTGFALIRSGSDGQKEWGIFKWKVTHKRKRQRKQDDNYQTCLPLSLKNNSEKSIL